MLLESLDVQLPQKEIIMLFRKYDADGSRPKIETRNPKPDT